MKKGKSAKKVVLYIISAIVILILVVSVAIHLFGDSALKSAVEKIKSISALVKSLIPNM